MLASFSASPLRFYPLLCAAMSKAHSRTGQFRRVSQNIFMYSANKNYYAIYKVAGKKICLYLDRDGFGQALPICRLEYRGAGKPPSPPGRGATGPSASFLGRPSISRAGS